MTTERRNDKRNAVPAEVQVLPVSQFQDLPTLDARVDAMVNNRNEVAIHNLDFILSQQGISQAKMCRDVLEGTPQPPQIAVYRSRDKDIPFRTVARIGMAYGYTPEEMYGQLLDHTGGQGLTPAGLPLRPAGECGKFPGTYQMAFFATDARQGSNNRTLSRALSFGVLSIYLEPGTERNPRLRAAALLNCTEEEKKRLLSCLADAERKGGGRAVRTCYEQIAGQSRAQEPLLEPRRMKCFYEGEVLLTERMVQLTLLQVRGSDLVQMALHNRAAASSEGSPYKGGLATMMSTSRGEEHMPCIQAAILSRRGFDHMAREELAELLFLEPPKMEFQGEIQSICTYMKTLFRSESGEGMLSQLSEEDRCFLLESFVSKKLSDVLRRNVLEYYKVSIEQDSRIYKLVCR